MRTAGMFLALFVTGLAAVLTARVLTAPPTPARSTAVLAPRVPGPDGSLILDDTPAEEPLQIRLRVEEAHVSHYGSEKSRPMGSASLEGEDEANSRG